MTSSKLSPAAQIVWDAAWQLSPVNCESHEDRRRQQIAAALRAAANYCSRERRILMTIADELDHSCQHLQAAPQVSKPFRFNYNHTTALRSAVDLLIDCVSPDYVASILADYRPGGARNKLARSLYTLIDELQRNNVVIEDVS